MDNVKIIGARRAYEFAPDEIRLSALTLPSSINAIRQALQFQNATVGTPAATFGPVAQTSPPGLTFNLGKVEAPAGTEVLIRTLSFESRRIVVDVAGFSSAIDAVYRTIREALANLKSGDGSPVLGEPIGTRDQSTITAHLSFAPADVLPPGLRLVFATAMGIEPGDQSRSEVVIPTVLVQRGLPGREYPGLPLNSPGAFQFDLRAGSSPDDQVYFSVAPLDTDGHLRYLQDLEMAVSGALAREMPPP